MTDPEADPAARSGRDMVQPYDGPEVGPGIAAHGRTAEGGLRAAVGFAEMIVDTVREGLLVLDLDLRVQAANESFYRMFDATRDETEGQLVYELDHGVWDRPELRVLLERVLPERHVFDDFEVETGEGDARRVYHLNGRQLDHHQMVLLAATDVTERVLARESLELAREDLERRVDARTQEVRDLATRLTVAEQAERQRIAQVLHDDLQQRLYGASMTLKLLQRAPMGEGAGALASKAAGILDEAVDVARTLAAELSPTILQTDRLRDILEWVASEKQRKYELGVGVEVRGDPVIPDLAHRVLLYQSVCEVLFNVVKHAGVDRARVTAWEEGGEVVLVVEDDGVGFNSASGPDGRPGGFGLSSVDERLRLVGGRFEVGSTPGAGTRVVLTVPV